MADDFCVNIFDEIGGVVGEMTNGIFNGNMQSQLNQVSLP